MDVCFCYFMVFLLYSNMSENQTTAARGGASILYTIVPSKPPPPHTIIAYKDVDSRKIPAGGKIREPIKCTAKDDRLSDRV
jgi:hypothetical protein